MNFYNDDDQAQDNPVQTSEIDSEVDAEVDVSGGPFEEKSNDPSIQTNSENAEENALEAMATEKAAGADQVMPAEIAAINTDNDLAQEATEELEKEEE